jgi:exopolysaccharide biosynthesis polyprenyl glycosylphosphotransferase
MINLEKIFQKDDEIYVLYSHLSQSIVIFFSLYLSSILNENVLYDILKFDLFLSSDFFFFTISVVFLNIISVVFIKRNRNYVKKIYYFLLKDIKNFSLIYLFFFGVYILQKPSEINFLWFFNSFVFSIISLFVLKLINNKIYKYLITNNIIQRNVMLIGKFQTVKNFIEIYKNKNKKSLIKCCILTDKKEFNYFNELKIPCFDYDERFFEILNYHFIGQIWFEIDENKNIIKDIQLEDLLKFPIDIKLFLHSFNKNLINSLTDKYNFASTQEKRKEYIFYSINNSRFTGLPLFTKFILDKVFSILILLITFPILLISIILILIEDGYPFIFVQTRTGWDGRKFKIYKLRTLKKINPNKAQQVFPNDNRLLFFGKFIRRLSIDELLQIYNVLKGEMSLVGPRPHMVEHSKQYSAVIKNFLTRHKCNPGITGWAQVNGFRGATNDDLMKKRMDYDVWYLKNWSLGLDFLIMLKTVYAIIKYRAD